MKKHNEGYVLVLVLVVILVISLLSAAILSFSLKNLQNQQAAVDRMEEEYATLTITNPTTSTSDIGGSE